MDKLAIVRANAEFATKGREFEAVARLLVLTKGDTYHASLLAENAPPSVKATLKAAVTAGGIGAWGAPLAEYDGIVAAFTQTLANVGAFDRIFPDMRRVPLRSRVAITTGAITGFIVGEGHIKALSSLALAGATIEPTKAVAIVAVSSELVTLAASEGNALFARELRTAVARVTDDEFVRIVSDGIATIPSSGSSATAILADLRTAVLAVSSDAGSRLYILMNGSTAKAIAFLGHEAFADMSPTGGSIGNTPVVVTDSIPSGQIVVVDATGVAAANAGMMMEVTDTAAMHMDTAPDSPPTASSNIISLWQQGLKALKVERSFAVERLRSTAVAVLTGVNYDHGNSP